MVLEHRERIKALESLAPSVKVHVHQDADVVLLDEPTGHLDVALGAWNIEICLCSSAWLGVLDELAHNGGML